MKSPHFSRSSRRFGPAVVTFAVGFALSATRLVSALDTTWTGGGADSNFTTPANWTNGAPTGSSTSNNLTFAGTTRLTPSQNISNGGDYPDFGTFTFDATAGAFTFGGNPIGFNAAVTNNSTNLQTFAQNVAFRTSSSVNAANGNIRFNGANSYIDNSTALFSAGAGKTITMDTGLLNGGNSSGKNVSMSGAGNLVFNVVPGYNGTTTVNGGNVTFNGGLGSSRTLTVATGGSVTVNLAATTQSLDGGGIVSGAGSFVKTGSGSLLLGGQGGGNFAVQLSAGGLVDVQGGVLRNEYGRQNWTNNLGSMNVASGATVDTWDGIGGVRVDALTGAGTVQHTNYNQNGNATNTLTVGVANGSGTFAGVLTDADGGGGGGSHLLALVKNGTGTQTLTGTNTFRGATTVSGGTLAAASAGALGSTSGISVSNVGTLLLNGGGTVNRVNNAAAIALAGGTVAVADASQEGAAATVVGNTRAGTSGAGLGALTLSANSTLNFDAASDGNLMVFTTFGSSGGSTVTVTNYANTHFDGTANSGLGTDDRLVFQQNMSGNLSLFDFGSGPGVGVMQIQLDSGFYEVGRLTAVPEPATWTGGGLIVAALAWMRRRRMRSRLSPASEAACGLRS